MNENGSRTDETGRDASPTFDSKFYRALGSRERRRLLHLLLDEAERPVEELATLLVGWDAAASETVGGPEDRRVVLIRLLHVHIPMLEDAGLVCYDEERGTVRTGSLDPVAIEYVRQGVDAEEAPPG